MAVQSEVFYIRHSQSFHATDYLTLTFFITGWWTGDGYGQFEKSHKDSGKLQRFFLYL